MTAHPGPRRRVFGLLCFTATLVSVSGIAQAGLVSFSDNTFANADWSQSITAFSTLGETTSASQSVAGGNPGDYRRAITTVSGTNDRIEVFDGMSGATYDPSAQGAILSLDFAIDHQQFSGFGSGHQFGLGLRQNGNVYAIQTTASNLGSFGSWQAYGLLGVTETSTWGNYLGVGNGACPAAGSAACFEASGPDFSASGSQIEFGFVYGMGNGSSPGPNTFISGFDNWNVTLTTADAVPEPGTLGLMAGSLAFFARRRTANSG